MAVGLVAVIAIAVVTWFAMQLLNQNTEEMNKPIIDVNFGNDS